MTLNLTQGSFKVIHFGRNRKPVYDFILWVVIVTFQEEMLGSGTAKWL